MMVSAVLASGSNLLLRHAMGIQAERAGEGSLLLAAVQDPWVLGGLFGYGLSHLLWLNVLSRARLGAMFPIFVSSTFIIVMAGSALILGEAVNAQRLAGAGLVALGMVVAEWSRAPQASEDEAGT